MDTGKSALGLDGNVAAALGYPIGIIAIMSLCMEKGNRFLKFHAIQSLLYHAAAIIVFVVLVIVLTILTIVLALISSALGALSSLLWLVYMIVFFAYLIGLIYAAVKAYNGDKFMLPVIGGMADKWTGN